MLSSLLHTSHTSPPHTTCLLLHTSHPGAGEEEGEVVLNAGADHEDDEVPDEAAVAEWAHLQDPGDSPDDVWKVGGTCRPVSICTLGIGLHGIQHPCSRIMMWGRWVYVQRQPEAGILWTHQMMCGRWVGAGAAVDTHQGPPCSAHHNVQHTHAPVSYSTSTGVLLCLTWWFVHVTPAEVLVQRRLRSIYSPTCRCAPLRSTPRCQLQFLPPPVRTKWVTYLFSDHITNRYVQCQMEA
jgi:hypothetical protein